MPTYEYRCTECNGTFERIFKINDRKEPEGQPCPFCGKGPVEQVFLTGVLMGDSVRLGFTRPDNGFREVLQKIHERAPGSVIKENSNLISI